MWIKVLIGTVGGKVSYQHDPCANELSEEDSQDHIQLKDEEVFTLTLFELFKNLAATINHVQSSQLQRWIPATGYKEVAVFWL